MSESESLRMVAEVVDNFSTPLRNLRAQLQGMGKDGGTHTEAVVKGFSKVEGAAKSAGQTVSTVMNPALAAVGITGLGVMAAMNGVGAAMRSLGGSVSALAMLGRETGISAENLRVLQGVMSKFGIEADASAGSIKTFTQNMREARDGIGPIMQFLRTQGRTAEGRAYFNGLADSLKNTKDNSEALMKALEGLEHIQDPAGRMKYAQELFGNADLGRLGDQHLGRLKEIVEQQRKLLGPSDPATVKAAEDFEKAMAGLRGTMQKLGTAVATEAMPYVSEFVTGLKSLADGGRQDITGPLRESVREIGKALREIDWKTAGEGAQEFVKGATDGIKSLLDAVHTVAAAIRSLNEGKWLDAIRRLDGADGSLARRAAPQAGDDKIERDEKAGGVRKEIDRTREQGNLQRDLLKEAEASGDKGKAAQMRSALELNSRRMKELEEALQKLTDGAATAQKMSVDGAATGFGGLIHKASFGGGVAGSMGRVGRVLGDRENGIYAPTPEQDAEPRRYGGPPEGSSRSWRTRERRALASVAKLPDTRSPLQRRNFGGGRFGLGGPVAPRMPSVTPGGPGDRVGRWQRGEAPPQGNGSGNAGAAATGDMMAYAMDQLRREGVSEEHLKQSAAHLVGQAQMESGLDPNKVHDGGTGYGIYGARDPKGWGNYRGARRSSMVRWLEANGYARNSAEGQMRYMAHEAMTGGYGRTRRILLGGGSGDVERDTNTITGEFEAPQKINRRSGAVRNAMRIGPKADVTLPELSVTQKGKAEDRDFFPNGAPRVLKPNSMKDALGLTMEEANRARAAKQSTDKAAAGQIDDAKDMRGVGAGFAAIRRYSESEAMRKAVKTGANGGAVFNADGKVEVHVARPGPDTKVSTSASGNLFRDVKLNRGKTMAPASPDS